jgi:hypothetical protein
MRELMILVQPRSLTAPHIAVLLLSVPPLVKNISEGWAFNMEAMLFLEASTANLFSLP